MRGLSKIEVVSLALVTVLGGSEVSRAVVLGVVIQGPGSCRREVLLFPEACLLLPLAKGARAWRSYPRGFSGPGLAVAHIPLEGT